MKVLLVNSIFWGGGVDSQTLTLARGLVKHGLGVVLAVPEKARLVPVARSIPGLQIEMIQAGRAGWPFALAALVRRHHVDVVHAHHGRDYWIAVLASRLPGSRAATAVTRHLMTPLSPGTRRHLGRFATAIAVSEAVERSLRQQVFAVPLPVRRIPCGIDTDEFVDSIPGRRLARQTWDVDPEAFTFALVANATPPDGKGHAVYVEAAARVAREHPMACFLCVGGGGLVASLKERVAQLGIAANFRFLEFTDDWSRQLPGIDALVHPAVGSEALGLVILEALSACRPVVASRLDGIPETFRDGEHGHLVAPRDVGGLAAAMMSLAADPARARAMGQRGREWIRGHYALDRLAVDTCRLYRELRPGAASHPP